MVIVPDVLGSTPFSGFLEIAPILSNEHARVDMFGLSGLCIVCVRRVVDSRRVDVVILGYFHSFY